MKYRKTKGLSSRSKSMKTYNRFSKSPRSAWWILQRNKARRLITEILPPLIDPINQWLTGNTNGETITDKLTIVTPDVGDVNCLSFAPGAYVATGIVAPLGVDNYFGACTISAWVYADSSGSGANRVVCGQSASAYRIIAIGNVWSVAGTTTTVPVAHDVWTFIEVDFNSDGGMSELRLDGVVEWTGVGLQGDVNSAHGMQIGARQGGLNWIGKISDLKISSPLGGHWLLQEGSGLPQDRGGNGNPATANTATWVQADGIPSTNLKDGFYVAVQGDPPFIPALADGSGLAANGLPLTNLGGKVHNQFEGSISQSPTATELLDKIVTGGVVYDYAGVINGRGSYSPTANPSIELKYDGVGVWAKYVTGTLIDSIASTSQYPPKTVWPSGDVAYDSPWVNDDGTLNKLFWADIAALKNGQKNNLMKFKKLGANDSCHLVEQVHYNQDTTDDWTEAEYNQGVKWAGDATCGAGFDPF